MISPISNLGANPEWLGEIYNVENFKCKKGENYVPRQGTFDY